MEMRPAVVAAMAAAPRANARHGAAPRSPRRSPLQSGAYGEAANPLPDDNAVQCGRVAGDNGGCTQQYCHYMHSKGQNTYHAGGGAAASGGRVGEARIQLVAPADIQRRTARTAAVPPAPGQLHYGHWERGVGGLGQKRRAVHAKIKPGYTSSVFIFAGKSGVVVDEEQK
jgi:hypothetical protein